MNLTDHLRRQFTYDAWANREVLSAMRNARGSTRSLQLMSHLLAAERVWIERLTAQPQSVAIWPDTDLGRCEAEALELGGMWLEYLNHERDISRAISYKNSKGEPFESAVCDVLTHVVMHSAYHRGQIASHMRANGQTPASTDFIFAVRQGLIK